MPSLSWTEIRQRAIQFSREWSEETQERSEAQSFWNDLFHVFGMKRRQVASFEERVKSIRGQHRIDLLWKGKLLAEHKSYGEHLGKATSQAFNYIQELINEGRQDECPRYVAISDFQTIVLYDLEPEDQLELQRANLDGDIERIDIPVAEFHKHIKHFAFIAGLQTQRLKEQDPANLKATKIMAKLHDELENAGYDQPDLERLLVRLLFCLFADDTGVFEPDSFELFVKNRTRADGYDLGMQLARLFEVLDTPYEKRSRIKDEELLAFPYVNGELFRDQLHFAEFTKEMRDALIAACEFHWERISPAIFGSLFQGVMDGKERRQIGAHYTSERDILKVIGPLFLDELREEFDQISRDQSTRRKQRLSDYHAKLGKLTFLDPACGCGNFLVMAYRELRRLELRVLKLLHDADAVQQLNALELQNLSIVDVDQFYGIEIDMWPSRIAETALWLTDHQMNRELSEAFGQIFLRIPLRKSPHIHCENALRVDWASILPPEQCNFVFGNPPFVGKKEQNHVQKSDHAYVWGEIKGKGVLDYVTCWYKRAGEYIDPRTRCAFVSTNSISQGEQVSVLWEYLFNAFRFKIHFAHRTFAWQSEASGSAHVHVVIIGFGKTDNSTKVIYEYENIRGDAKATFADNVNPYLVDAPDVTISNRSKPICDVKPINYGSMMIDKDRKSGTEDGLIIDVSEKTALIRECPDLEPFIRRIYGGEEYINGTERWCLWLVDAPAHLLRACERLKQRITRVRDYRLSSGRQQTRKLATTPFLFGEIRQPKSEYLLIPKVSSETRNYIPIGFVSPEIIASGSALLVPSATSYDFGVLSSAMHNSWIKYVAGRMKSDPHYSARLVYNNFPWPQKATRLQIDRIERAAEAVLMARSKYLDAGSNLADLYDPITMPSDLYKAHEQLDRAVDKAYRGEKFTSERERVEFLFGLYEEITSPITKTKPRKPRKGAQPMN